MAVRLIQANELLGLADHLAGRTAGPGKPRTIYLRRSISTAYYALFHYLSQHTAQRLLGDGWSPKHAGIARWIAHTDLANLAQAATGKGNVALVSALAPVDPRLAQLAQDFLDLQDARHGADYDDFFEVSRLSALSYVSVSRSAITTCEQLLREKDPSYGRLLGLALGGSKIAKSR